MLKTRIIPCLQLIDESLVKTVKFSKQQYIGDPINTVRIFNELEVDELCFLDIRASIQNRSPKIKILREIADECFMPLSYGGGIKSLDEAKEILSIGFEKIVINTQAYYDPTIVKRISGHFGSQSLIASIDVKKNVWGNYVVYIKDGTEKINMDPVEWAQKLENLGAGEILLTSIDRDGTWGGFDLEITKKIANSVNVPVIANGGAGKIEHIRDIVKNGYASAVGLGSMVVYQKEGMGVLVNFPDKIDLENILQ